MIDPKEKKVLSKLKETLIKKVTVEIKNCGHTDANRRQKSWEVPIGLTDLELQLLLKMFEGHESL